MINIKPLHSKLLWLLLFVVFLNALAFVIFSKHASPLPLSIFPDNQAPYKWSIEASHDPDSSLNLEDSVVSIYAGLKLSGKSERPYAEIALDFNKDEDKTVSFAEFSRIKILLKCSTRTTLYLGLATQDPKVTQHRNFLSYRTAGTFITCDTEWREVVVNLDSLTVPDWWLSLFKFEAVENTYDLSKVLRVYLEANYEVPRDTEIKVNIAKISFDGQKEGSVVIFAVVSLLLWVCFLGWMVRFYWKENRGKGVVQVLEYEPLRFDSIKDRDKQSILEYISKNFSDREIDVKSVCNAVGVSRTKVSDVLKSEFGGTFPNYINKLRLIEASRLLIEKQDASITEIAHSLGFQNLSYFNRLFKEQFGLTPKEFKNKKDSS